MGCKIKIGDGVVDEWRESGIEPQVGIVIEYMPNKSLPYKIWWAINESVWGYSEEEVLEMKEAYEKHKS